MNKISNRRKQLKQRQRRRKIKRIIRRVIYVSIVVIPLLIIYLIGSFIHGRWEAKTAATASFVSAGDVIMHGPFLKSNEYKTDDGYDYNPIFTYVADNYNASDFAIVNFESTITSNENDYTSYPMFRSPDDIAVALAKNGVDMALLANNHMYDNFSDGISMTIDAMEENSIVYTGAQREDDQANYHIQDVNGIKIGIFNYTAETEKDDNGKRTINAIPVKGDDIDLINTFNYDELSDFYKELKTGLDEMQEAGVDLTVAYLHWGVEYQTTQNKEQEKIAQKLCDMGIDVLIGGHPHVIQPIDVLNASEGEHKMICAYSVGNHLANQHKGRIASSPDGHTEDGLMINLKLEKTNGGDISLVNFEVTPTWTYRTVGVSDDQNPEFFIFPLNDPEQIIKKAKETSDLNIEDEVNDSLERTNEIIGEGLEKVKKILPLAV